MVISRTSPEGSRSPAELGRLRRLIDRLEAGAEVDAETGGEGRGTVSTGWPSLEGLPVGAVHEWFGVEPRRTQSPRGAARCDWRPPLFLLAHLAGRALEGRLARDRSSARAESGAVLWIGRRLWPYPHALVRSRGTREVTGEAAPEGRSGVLRTFELERADGSCGGEELLARSLFIDPRDDGERLWAIDVALRSRAVAAVVADGSRLSMAATRRLQLAARAGEALALLARPPWEVRELSAATTRFVVRRSAPESSEDRPDTRLRWTAELVRAKGARPMTSRVVGRDLAS